MSAAQAAAYLLRKHGIKVTRQTVYNWMKTGRRGEVLKSTHDPIHGYRTTVRNVDDFVSRLH